MLVLDATTKSITAQMSSAATTTNPSFVTAYSDDNGTTFVEGSSDGALNGSTQVTVVASPAASTRRLIKTIYIANIDTVANTLTITLNDNSTLRTIVKVTLNSGDTWSTDGTTDTNGNLKTTVGSVNLANVTGTLGAINGGTGAVSLTGYVYGNGTSAMTASTTVPTTALSGTVTNAQLANSSLTVNGTAISLGGSGTVTAAAGTLTGTTLNSTVVTSSLTSVGTIGTGVWNGTVITGTYGGTGVNNGSSTITLGGSFTTSGAFTTTLTVTANTNVTLPTTGTVATLAGSETFTNKTLTNPTVTNYVETLYAPSAGSAFTISLANGTIQEISLNANGTITLPSSVAGKSFTIIVTYSGSYSLTWAGGGTLKWAGGTTPTATSTSGKYDIFNFYCDGTNTFGSVYGLNF